MSARRQPLHDIAAEEELIRGAVGGILEFNMTGAPLTSHTAPLDAAQAAVLKRELEHRGYRFESKPYTLFAASKPGVNVSVYEKGPKVLVQGKGTREFVEFLLEPIVLGTAALGYEEVLDPAAYEAHAGVDEGGKGDFFGPLIVAAVYVHPKTARSLRTAGVRDSKRISSDKIIRELADAVRRTTGPGAWTVIELGPSRYNALYKKIGNLNKLLAWGHARAIENILERVPDCPRALSDKFGDARLIERALMTRGRGIVLEQRTKAESDVAVAAASIMARERFLDWHIKAAREYGVRLPRGASAQVRETARQLVEQHGPGELDRVAKTHFRTAWEVAPEAFPEPPPRREWTGPGRTTAS